MKHRFLLVLSLLLFFQAPTGAATLDVAPDGTLQGAMGVLVNGHAYDVAFKDGTCSVVFPDCQSGTVFAFHDRITASAAAQALLDTVFIDRSATRPFDTHPERTKGCLDPSLCEALTPYGVVQPGTSLPTFVDVVTALNGNGVDAVDALLAGTAARPIQIDYPVNTAGTVGNPALEVWAVWSPVTAVPVPGSLYLLSSALILLTGLSMRGNRSGPERTL